MTSWPFLTNGRWHTRWSSLLTTQFISPTSYPCIVDAEVVVPSLVAHELPERESSPVGEPLESGARVLVQARRSISGDLG